MQVTVGVDAVPEPMKPKLVEPDAARAPLYVAFVATSEEPLAVTVEFHDCCTVCELPYDRVTRQPLIAAEPAVTFTSAW